MGLVVFVLDILKGLAPAAVARSILTSPVAGLDSQVVWLVVGFMAVLGHSFSPFIRFKGGKGISTALGAGLGAAPVVALSSFGVFALVLAASRYVGLSSIIAALSSVMFAAFLPGESHQLVPLFGVLWLLIVWRHRKNLRRMRDGTEPKFTFRRTIPPPATEPGLKEAPRQIG
jgi:glycerol-3-phosphate acyltransferase PlsY